MRFVQYAMSTMLASTMSVYGRPQYGDPDVAAVDRFIESHGLDPGSIEQDIKAALGAPLACGILDLLRGGQVQTKADGQLYTEQAQAHWSATARGNPTCIFSPSNTEDVSLALNVVNFTKTKFAVRSGGHCPNAGFASIDDGVLISTTNINDISYDAAAQSATVGFGLRWGAIYAELQKYGVTVVGGRVNDVGMALVPGGGLSWLSNLHGFSVDNLISYNVVLADGSIVTASETSEPELFWGLKGGLGNFGIITHMTLKTYPSDPAWGGSLIFNATEQDRMMEAIATYQENGEQDQNSGFLTYLLLNNETISMTLVRFGTTARPEAFQPFFDIPTTSDRTAQFDSLTALLASTNNNVPVTRAQWAVTTFYVDREFYVDVARYCVEQSRKVEAIPGGTYVILPQPISLSMINAAQGTGGNALGLRSRQQTWMQVVIGYLRAEDEDFIGGLVRESMEWIENEARARGLYDPFLFLSDAGGYQDPLRSYGAENYARLQAVNQRYDPTGFFQTQMPGGFKLS